MTTILSKDIQSLIQADKIDNNYTVKRKLLWGPDGVGYDITPQTPLPVTATFTGTAGFSLFGQGTPSLIAVTNISTQLLALNLNRKFARIVNNSTSRIYIQYGIAAVIGEGLPMKPNSILTIDANELWLGIINAISETILVNIDVMEGV